MRHSPAWMLLCSLAGTALAQVEAPPRTAPATPPGAGSAAPEPAGSGLRLPPVLWSGAVSLDLRHDKLEAEPSHNSRLATATLNGITYIYAPWLALVNGSVSLTSGNETGSDESSSSTRFVTGKLNVGVFPRSRFPTELRYEVNDSRIDSSLGGGTDYRSRNVGVTQRYRPASGQFNVSASYDRRSQDSAEFGHDTQDALMADFSSSWKRHQLAAGLTRNVNKRSSTGEETDFLAITARHSLSTEPALSVETTANWVHTDDRLLSGESTTTLAQLSSLGIWRSQSIPLTLNGSVLALKSSGSSSNGTTNLGVGFGGTYEFSQNARLAGSITATRLDGQNTLTTIGALTASYQGDQRQWGPYQWSWYTSGALSGARATTSEASLTNQLGHTLSRSWYTGASTWTAGLSQTLSTGLSNRHASEHDLLTTDKFSRAITQTASIGWTRPTPEGTAFGRLALSDARQFDNEKAHFQLLNFQLSGNHEIDRRHTLGGDITVQRTFQSARQLVDRDSVQSLLNVQQRNRSASGEISWNQLRVFNVPRLNFTSRLRLALNTQSQSNELRPLPDRETGSWENRLDYRVGRLESSLALRLARIDGRQQMFVMWRLQRTFGG